MSDTNMMFTNAKSGTTHRNPTPSGVGYLKGILIYNNDNRMFAVIKSLFYFLWKKKMWWLAPIIILLMLVVILIVFGQSSVLSPFVYTVF